MTKRVSPKTRSPRLTAHAVFALAVGVAALTVGCSVVAPAQQLPTPNPNLVLLDPAHGGPDPGAHLTATLAEKDVNLAFAARLRTTLAAKGFSVLSTRDADIGLTSLQRAETANHAHPGACLLLHATSSGSGIYLAASSLAPDTEPRPALPWETAQAAFIPQSLSLLDGITRSVTALSARPIVLRASVPPIDSVTCATVLVELAPLSGKPATDEGYQQKVADGLADALVAWRTQQTPVKTPRPDTSAAPAAAPSLVPTSPTTPAPAKPRPKVGPQTDPKTDPKADPKADPKTGPAVPPLKPPALNPFGTGAPR